MSVLTDNCFDVASIEAFTADLVAAGFEPVPGSQRGLWRGPIHEAFAPLTDAATMDIAIVPGWPLQPPAVLVEGLNTNHSTLDGLVCMWREGDATLRWTTVKGLFDRIEEWCRQAQGGWKDDDLGQDALLNFRRKDRLLATFDFEALGTSAGGWGDFHATRSAAPPRFDLRPGRSTSPMHLRGLWFRLGELETPPPRRLSEVSTCLSRKQRKGLERALRDRQRPDTHGPSGGVDLVLFCWERNGRPNLLVMVCEGVGDNVDAIALQPGPNDEATLILRAGPDASMLRSRRAVLFGAGALGGHVAVTLAESGLGSLDLVDDDVLSPGNVVRHVAGHDQVGAPKVEAVEKVARNHAPWTEVRTHRESPRAPSEIRMRIREADVIVDATGDEAFTLSLAMAARAAGKPLISGALYRGGFVGRVQREARADDTPIELRADSPHYLLIPPGDDAEDLATPDVGCSAPVNNAPPSAVLACSSLIAHAAIDILTGRFELDDEVVDVYRVLPGTAPFDRVGRLQATASCEFGSDGSSREATVQI